MEIETSYLTPCVRTARRARWIMRACGALSVAYGALQGRYSLDGTTEVDDALGLSAALERADGAAYIGLAHADKLQHAHEHEQPSPKARRIRRLSLAAISAASVYAEYKLMQTWELSARERVPLASTLFMLGGVALNQAMALVMKPYAKLFGKGTGIHNAYQHALADSKAGALMSAGMLAGMSDTAAGRWAFLAASAVAPAYVGWINRPWGENVHGEHSHQH